MAGERKKAWYGAKDQSIFTAPLRVAHSEPSHRDEWRKREVEGKREVDERRSSRTMMPSTNHLVGRTEGGRAEYESEEGKRRNPDGNSRGGMGDADGRGRGKGVERGVKGRRRKDWGC